MDQRRSPGVALPTRSLGPLEPTGGGHRGGTAAGSAGAAAQVAAGAQPRGGAEALGREAPEGLAAHHGAVAAAGAANRVTAGRPAKVQDLCRLHRLGGAERDPRPGGRLPVSAPLAGLLDHLRPGHRLIRGRCRTRPEGQRRGRGAEPAGGVDRPAGAGGRGGQRGRPGREARAGGHLRC